MFKLHSEYKPTGDQPQAIEYLSNGIKEGKKFQTLLGVTGSGKTFTMANIIEKVQRPREDEISTSAVIQKHQLFPKIYAAI